MATYSAITNAEIDQDSPITQALLTKYRENPKADFEGSGTGVAFAAIADMVAGDYVLDSVAWSIPTNTSWNIIDYWNVYKAGTYRIKLYLNAFNASSTLYARVYRNGSAYGTERSATNQNLSFSEDLSFSVGDTIQIYARHQTGASGWVAASVCVGNPWHVNIHCPGLNFVPF